MYNKNTIYGNGYFVSMIKAVKEGDIFGYDRAGTPAGFRASEQPLYPVERYVTVGEEKVLFGDGSHIIYVNGRYRGDDEIGRLMHDFSCTEPDDMNFEELAKRARYFKKDEKGVAAMCKMMEDMRNEAAQNAELNKAKKTAVHLIKLGKMTLEEIAEATELSLDIVKELENN